MAGRGPVKPLNVEQIVQQAENFEYNPLVPFRYWSRSAGTLIKEAEIYEAEGNEQQAYLLLFRHARLILDKLSTHPESRSREHDLVLQQLRKDVLCNFSKLEALKPRINKRYDRYQRILTERNHTKATNDALADSRRISADHQNESAQTTPESEPAMGHASEALTAKDNRDLAVRLARKEIRRRATARKATRQVGISEEEDQDRRTAGLGGDWEDALITNGQEMDQDTISNQMHNVRLQLNGSKGDAVKQADSLRSQYKYPTVPHHSANPQTQSTLTTSGRMSNASTEFREISLPPGRPPKGPDPSMGQPSAPPKPCKEEISPAEPFIRSGTSSPAYQDLKPSTFAFKPSAHLENGTPLRTVFLPPDLRSRFLSIAQPNTKANLETCGILCGTLISNALFISKLVIPEQESTSDTCETINESDLFDYVDGEDLMVLGWIHTHPTQTCFMSSRDLHTHSGYQVMIPESIAIVCAPSKQEYVDFMQLQRSEDWTDS
ncbi:MAG: hypothetical protein Q9220_007017 [cf. Caloplaca sp. 1 TL-2023]